MSREKLTAKKVLFIAPNFYGYDVDVFNEIKKQNYKADMVSYSYGAYKLRWKKRKLKNKIILERARITELIDNNTYDYLFVIKGEILCEDIILQFKKKNPNAVTINYQWDSIKNLPFDIDFINLFDSKYSFDLNDCINYSNLIHKPLFFTNDFLIGKDSKIEYDIATVGGMQLIRVNFIRKLKQVLPLKKYKICLRNSITLNLPINLYRVGLIRFFSYGIFRDMNKKDVAALLSKSTAVIDVSHPDQSGLTMRTIETLALGCKLITTNEKIKKYDFFNSNNIFVCKTPSANDINAFMTKPLVKVDEKIIDNYSIGFFVNSLLTGRNMNYLTESIN